MYGVAGLVLYSLLYFLLILCASSRVDNLPSAFRFSCRRNWIFDAHLPLLVQPDEGSVAQVQAPVPRPAGPCLAAPRSCCQRIAGLRYETVEAMSEPKIESARM